MDYRRGTVWVPRVLINTHVARRLHAFSFVSVTASAVISLEHLRPPRPHFICVALPFSREAAGLSGRRLFFIVEKDEQQTFTPHVTVFIIAHNQHLGCHGNPAASPRGCGRRRDSPPRRDFRSRFNLGSPERDYLRCKGAR